ncbi:MAG TPA: PQQ-dependent sugar dehydrogenase, partial [Bacteroidota bacterium]|nr:PQQ-dependent sugar dehydrogenase [Bacteroidota bacterium]
MAQTQKSHFFPSPSRTYNPPRQTASNTISLPPGFYAEDVVQNTPAFNAYTAMTFTPDGRIFLCGKNGIIYVVQNGQLLSTPLLDIHLQVQSDGDRGIEGIALDPNFAKNRFFYLSYMVDPDSDGISSPVPVWGRVARFTVSASNPNVADPTSRFILIGHSWADGTVDCSNSHMLDEVKFSPDGTLLVSCGDGGNFAFADSGGTDPAAFVPGKFDTSLDIGAFRAQYLKCMNGKILRIDPATGGGTPSNPFFTGNPMDPQSKVWAYGVRHPFRFDIRPGTSSSNPADAKPGILYVGNVGWNTWEAIDVVPNGGGTNYGWPCYEGPGPQLQYEALHPKHSGCWTIGTLENPASVTAPLLTYNHDDSTQSIPAGYTGFCSLGCMFYEGNYYPSQYKNGFFYTDLAGWMRFAQVDSNNNLIAEQPFAANLDGPVQLMTDPTTGDIYYLSIYDGQIRHIGYGTPNAPITAVGSVGPSFGPAPLTVNFVGTSSFDPHGLPLTFSWDFGDNNRSSLPSTVHTYTNAGTFIAKLKIQNSVGDSSVQQFCVATGTNYSVGYDANRSGAPFAFITNPTGGGSRNLSVANDNVFPPVNSSNLGQQYDTYTGTSIHRGDWYGFGFNAIHTFCGLIFQEGRLEDNGGYFTSDSVQVHTKSGWQTVANLTSNPTYPPATHMSFKTYAFAFSPMTGDSIRLIGSCGGSSSFTSIAELRAVAT